MKLRLENNLDFNEIRKQFFDDVKNYEEVIGSRKEIERLKTEVKNLEEKNCERKRKILLPIRSVIEGIT